MNTKTAAVQQKAENPITVLRHELKAMAPEFMAVLPPQISIESFTRVVLTALQNTKDLATCSKVSIWNAAMRAANDGLLPDGREGAIVPFGGEATWLPMVGGLRKKIFQSGKVATLQVEVVREKDEFDHQEGDGAFIHHKKYLGKDPPGEIKAVYSIATMKDGGEISREIMSLWEVEQVRKSSRGKNTPWNNPDFYPEMVKKTCVKRHYKSLPQSKETVEFFERDDVADGFIEPSPTAPPRPRPSDFTDVPAETDKPAGETKTDNKEPAAAKTETKGKGGEPPKDPEPPHDADTGEIKDTKYARQRGRDDADAGRTARQMPKEFATPDVEHLGDAWLEALEARYEEINQEKSGQNKLV